MPENSPAATLSKWIGGFETMKLHHIHIKCDDVEKIRKAYEGIPGTGSVDLHDVRAFNGVLALMVHADPVSIEYIQVTDPETGLARLIKDDPMGLNAIDFLVLDEAGARSAAKAAGFLITGEMTLNGCKEIWLKHPGLELSIEFMVPPPPGYRPGSDPRLDGPSVQIYRPDGTTEWSFPVPTDGVRP